MSLHLQASPRFPVHLMQQLARTPVLTGLEAQLWHPSSPSRSRSRVTDQAPPAQQEEGDDKVEVSMYPPAIAGRFWFALVALSTLPDTLEDNQLCNCLCQSFFRFPARNFEHVQVWVIWITSCITEYEILYFMLIL